METAATSTDITVYHHHGRSIRDLPTELLYNIFQLVYDDPDNDDSMFPYAIASTCTTWRNIMLSKPKFWEDLTIFIDPPATPLSAIASHLRWSSHFPILAVTIRRRPDSDDPVDGQQERSQILTIMNMLDPHIHRIQELYFHVTFSSALPRFPIDFRGEYPILDTLELECKEDDGGPDDDAPVAILIPEDKVFQCPGLKTFSIDGRNYYEACRRDMAWTEMISSVVFLHIAKFTARPDESFSSSEFLLSLAPMELQSLYIEDVELCSSDEELEIPDLPITDTIRFKNMRDPLVMNFIIHLMTGVRVSFVHCTIGGSADELAHFGFGHPELEGKLELQEIEDDMAPLLQLWDGSHLRIRECPSFDDDLLDAMGFEEDGEFEYATFLRELCIDNCPNFSIAALRRLVESRLHLPNDVDDPWNPNAARIHRILLVDEVPMVSEADEAWFKVHVPEFKILTS